MAKSVLTSETHPLQISEVRLGEEGDSAIGLTFCPGKKQPNSISGNWQRDLQTDLLAVKRWGAAAIVTLMPQSELKGVKAEGIGDTCEALGMEWYHLPIVDVQVPDEQFERHWIYAGLRLRQHLASGRRILIHCRGGLGRTGTIAGRLLVEMDWEPTRAIAEVRRVRPGAIETTAQEKYVLKTTKPAYDEPFLERMLGCLMGGAIGDAFGYAVEFNSFKEIQKTFGPKGLREPRFVDGRLVVSDDTQMTLFTLEGLLHGVSSDRNWHADTLTHSVFDAYQDWLYTQGHSPKSRLGGQLAQAKSMLYKRAPGNTCLSALAKGQAGSVDAPINDSKGCGGVMRTAPVGFLPNQSRGSAQRLGEALGAITHGHKDGWLPAGAMAGLVSLLMQGESMKSAAKQVTEHLKTYPSHDVASRHRTFPLLTLALNLCDSHRTRPLEAIQILGQGWTGDEALAIALYCAMTGRSFVDVVRRATNHDGDSDSTASIAGQLFGAWRGVFTIPNAWILRLDVLDEIVLMVEGWIEQIPSTAPPIDDIQDRISLRDLHGYVLNVIRMVQVLHTRGYQRLRISPGLSGSGCYFRVVVTPASNTYQDNGALQVAYFDGTAIYTTGSINRYFGWHDAQDDGPGALADKFLVRFPEIAEAGRGRDWQYSGWYNEMIGFAEQGHFPMAYCDYWHEPPTGTMHTTDYREGTPMLPAPPGGEGPASLNRESPGWSAGDDDDDDSELEEGYEDGDEEDVDDDDEGQGKPYILPPPLASFDIADAEQRIKALCAFHRHGLGQLMPFTQLIWDRLKEPKSDRAELFAEIVGIKAKGKLAIRKLLKAFYEEATRARLDALDARGVQPELAGFTDLGAYLVRLAKYVIAADDAMEVVAKRYALALNGDHPSEDGLVQECEIIQGPWKPIDGE